MDKELQTPKKDYFFSVSVLASAIIIAGALIYSTGSKTNNTESVAGLSLTQTSEIEEGVLPSRGVVLPVRWGDLGSKLVGTGVIDAEQFKAIYDQRGAFSEEYESLLFGQNNGNLPAGEAGLKITNDNAGYLLNLFWALGLANENPILESGEMTNPRYGGAQNFASTGGWTIADGDPMSHYSQHQFFTLTLEQQALVDKVSRGIYRPCCGNSTHFPDCNHGMAMLGLLELMASQGISEQKMWETALAVNSYWFPDAYLAIAQYFESRGISWEKVNPKEILGAAYSSASGYQKIMEQVKSRPNQGGGGCSVEPAPAKTSGGCEV
ncbi:MAG TPA: hypothetical protein VJB62_00850 [Patescibacteria group bacterium]|nr:hypothetical protein [Patescibacteria group bacterium]